MTETLKMDCLDRATQQIFQYRPVPQTTRIEGDIPVNLKIRNNKKFLFISKDQRHLTHGIHKYPAKFFPELPRWIISRYSKCGEYVLDPFTGSGTTNLECSLLGRNSVGVDVDPFSRFLVKAKTTLLPDNELTVVHENLLRLMNEFSPSKKHNGVPEFPYRDNWFKSYILIELAYIRSSIEQQETTQEIKDFFLVCFSSIIRAVSEADNNCTRTVVRKKLNKQVLPGAAIKRFIKRMEYCVNGMLALIASCPSGAVTIPDMADARDLSAYKDDCFDLALTSPPYLNAVDYPRTHQLEMYWLGMENGSLINLKRKHVGTESVTAKDYSELHKTGCRSADRLIKSIYSVDNRRAFIATKYIRDMECNLIEVYRVLKPGKRYVIVVGNNLVRGYNFETWRYLKEIAPSVGFRIERYFISEIINHYIKVPRKERINDDYVLVLQK